MGRSVFQNAEAKPASPVSPESGELFNFSENKNSRGFGSGRGDVLALVSTL